MRERLFKPLTQREVSILARKMNRVQDNRKVPDDIAYDAEGVFRDLIREAFHRHNEGKWSAGD